MRVIIQDTWCTISKEKEYKQYKNESQLLHQVKMCLNNEGYDLIKKLMSRDGHMVDDTQHYLRSKQYGKYKRGMAIYDHMYAVRDSAKELSQYGQILFTVSYF